jgi:hypothetical protein
MRGRDEGQSAAAGNSLAARGGTAPANVMEKVPGFVRLLLD